MMLIDQDRVVEIAVPDVPTFGTGYLLCNGCVLTANHVVQQYGSKGINCRLLGNNNKGLATWTRAQPIWVNKKFDLALLKFTHELLDNARFPNIKKLDLNRKIPCRAYGFPDFRKQEQKGKTTFNPYVVEGWIKPLTPKDSGELLIEIEGAKPIDMNGWKGISGSAIFSEDGYLIGVVTQGPEKLMGGQLEGISLEEVIENDSKFHAQIKKHFQQDICCLDVDKIEALNFFALESKLTTLKVKKKISAIRYDLEIEDLQSRLAKHTQSNKYAEALSLLPEGQLLSFLSQVEKTDGDIFWEAWRKSPASEIIKEDIPINQAYSILWNLDKPEQFVYFLSCLYHLLSQGNRKDYLERLIHLTRSVCGYELSASTSPLKNEVSRISKGSLLIKIKSTHKPKDDFVAYSVIIWLVPDRKLYQDRFRKTDLQTINLDSSYSEQIGDEILIKVESDDFGIQAKAIKQKISEILTKHWKNKTLGLKRNKPEVIFCVPLRLLEVDFHNIELGSLSTLGLEVPVSVSCLERYQDDNLSDSKDDWLNRWQVLERFCDELSVSHFEFYDKNVVDITCPRKLHRWLQRQDLLRQNNGNDLARMVAGFGFDAPYEKLIEIFESFLVNGLPIVFWPSQPLNNGNSLQETLKVAPENILSAIKRYRISSETEDAGSLAILFDNPFFPPPDCEIDYY